MIDGAGWIVVLVQILCVDLLLGADNAVVIALACLRLPAEETRRAVMLGAVGAIALRLGMLAFANALLDVQTCRGLDADRHRPQRARPEGWR